MILLKSFEFATDCCFNSIVKKYNQDLHLENKDTKANENQEIEKIKTTNVNILLNRVRLDKKRTQRKRILFFLLVSLVITLLSVYFIT